MLVGYAPPNITATADSDPAGAVLIGASAVTDGRLSSIARLIWPDGVAAISDYVAVRLSWQDAAPIRIVGVLGIVCPDDVRVQVLGRRAGDSDYTYALGGNSDGQRVVRLVDDTLAVWAVLSADNSPLIGAEIRIYNDADGAPWAAPGDPVDIGQVVVTPAVDIPIDPDWGDTPVDPSVYARTLGSQVDTVPRRSYRRLRVTYQSAHLSEVLKQRWREVASYAQGGRRLVAIPRWCTPGGAIDVEAMHRTAVYGIGTFGESAHILGNYFSAGLLIDEVPAIGGRVWDRPASPETLWINGEPMPASAWGDLVASWDHDGASQPGVSYAAQWYLSDTLVRQVAGLTIPMDQYTPPAGSGGATMRVVITVTRGGVAGYPPLTHTFVYRATLISETGDRLVSEDGAALILE